MSEHEYDTIDREEIWKERRRRTHCRCGNPDWPGRCPGPAFCPCCETDEDKEAPDA